MTIIVIDSVFTRLASCMDSKYRWCTLIINITIFLLQDSSLNKQEVFFFLLSGWSSGVLKCQMKYKLLAFDCWRGNSLFRTNLIKRLRPDLEIHCLDTTHYQHARELKRSCEVIRRSIIRIRTAVCVCSGLGVWRVDLPALFWREVLVAACLLKTRC